MRRLVDTPREFCWDVCIDVLLMGAVAAVLQPRWLLADTIPTGGDTASHYFYAARYAQELLPSGHLTAWLPEVFGGLPFLSYYFPLPFIVIALLGSFTTMPVAFKLGYCAAAIATPMLAYGVGRGWLGLPRTASLAGAMAVLAFLLHENNAVWGGNLLSVLAGEFAYSYGMLLAFMTGAAWLCGFPRRSAWLAGGVLEALTGFSHGYALLFVGFSSVTLFFLYRDGRAVLRFLLLSHALAFLLLAGWLWPLLEMHGLTVPNDYPHRISDWRELFPRTLWPVAALGLIAAACGPFNARFRALLAAHRLPLGYAGGSALVALLGWFGADRWGLADIRFYPFVLLMASLACGWLAGLLAHSLLADLPSWPRQTGIWLLLAGCLAAYGWLRSEARQAPQWAQWNHSGLESKAGWQQLAPLLPAMRQGAWGGRLLFEHDPANNDLGSTRVLESLPLFLAGRPVLEGLYMESALLGPAIYQLQAEVSANPSSPLARFPARSKLDATMAAKHMQLLHADQVLLRSEPAKQMLAASPDFELVAESGPFQLYRLRHFSSQWVEIVRQPLRIEPTQGMLERALAWFRSNALERYWPIYSDRPLPLAAVPSTASITGLSLDRWRIAFNSDAIGVPHIVKMAYHPRWHLRTAGTVLPSGPGFLTVIPAESAVVLEYADTPWGRRGAWCSAASLLVLPGLYWLARRQPANAGVPERRSIAPLVFAATAALLCAALYFTSAETAYRRAWKAMDAQQPGEAAAWFARALGGRRAPAAQEEALFWLAKSQEMAGNLPEALTGYARLIAHYDGYWLPESLYTYALLQSRAGQPQLSQQAACRLLSQYSRNLWAERWQAKHPLPTRGANDCDAEANP
jgi:hypothetical protein